MAKIRFPISSKCRPLLKRLDVRMLFLSMKANELSQSSYKWSNLEHSQPGAPKFFTQIKFIIFYQKFLIVHRKNHPNHIFWHFAQKTSITKISCTFLKKPTPPKLGPPKFLTQPKFHILPQKYQPNQNFLYVPKKPTLWVRFKELIIRPTKFHMLSLKKTNFCVCLN